MKTFDEWVLLQEIGPNDPIPSNILGRKVADFKNWWQGKSPVNWNAEMARREKEQELAPFLDPNVKQQKFHKLSGLFHNAMQAELKGIRPNNWQQVVQSLDNLAKALTFGQQIRGSDLHNILLAIHTSRAVRPEVKLEKFSDHLRLANFLLQIFEQNPDTWFRNTGNTQDMFPPGTVRNTTELAQYIEPWQSSPFRYRSLPTKKPRPQASSASAAAPQKTAVEQAFDFFVNFKKRPLPEDVYKVAAKIYDDAKNSGSFVNFDNMGDNGTTEINQFLDQHWPKKLRKKTNPGGPGPAPAP